jgi:hypothetical protein
MPKVNQACVLAVVAITVLILFFAFNSKSGQPKYDGSVVPLPLYVD